MKTEWFQRSSGVTVNICILNDPDFSPLAEYTADDVARCLSERPKGRAVPGGAAFRDVSHRELEALSRDSCDLLILPYVRGNFSERALGALVDFHAAGGSLLFLGDLPNRDKWYPLRNMQADLLHMTRCGDGMNVEGLTPEGERILGDLKDVSFFEGKRFSGLRFTAYPPDVTHSLIKNNSGAWSFPIVVAVERYCERFLGAKLAAVGFNGGEPRENVDGAYQKKWTYDPGMLTREWPGCDDMIWKLVRWLEPASVAGAIDLRAVHREGEAAPIEVVLRNLTAEETVLEEVTLRCGSGGEQIFREARVALKPDETRRVAVECPARGFGIHEYVLETVLAGSTVRLAAATERVFPVDSSEKTGYGFSTFWAFRQPEVPESYRYFARQMLSRGCQYLRANVPWEDVEPEPGRYDWRIPDQLIEVAGAEGFGVQFWMFPTTRGSGLGDGGVPWWVLKEPAIDRDGGTGFFPSIWSPFYREHYFGMIDECTRRYAASEPLRSFVLDFGNSDFPYGYYFYVNDQTLFDYSPHERSALARYLREERGFELSEVGRIFDREFDSWDEVPVPLAEDKEPWRVYLAFREWSIQSGIRHAFEIVRRNAPEKLPPDQPGHGLGSIADLSSYFYDVKARHWLEEKKFDSKYTHAHSAGREWGGEAWQVGGSFKEYDDALFQSVRLNASYLTIPGPDLGVFGDDIAKVGFIRRTIMGAERRGAEIAVLDRTTWNSYQSLAHVAARLDQSADLLCSTHRFDFSCYRLMVLPPDEVVGRTVTGGGGGALLPSDEHWYWLLRECVEKGLHLLVFPRTCLVGESRVQMTFLRQVLDLMDVEYGERAPRRVAFPDSFGGGALEGLAAEVRADGEVLLSDDGGAPVLVERPLGRGSVLLAGYDTEPDSLDGAISHERDEYIGGHTLARLAGHLGIVPRDVDTGQLYIYKDLVHRQVGQAVPGGEAGSGKDYLLLYSHLPGPAERKVRVRLSRPSGCAFDLATGESFEVARDEDDWHSLTVTVHPRQGRYLSFHDGAVTLSPAAGG